MILNDRDIKALVKMGDLGIDPYNEDQVQPASYDFTIADDWAVPMLRVQHAGKEWLQPKYLDLRYADEDLAPLVRKQESYVLRPGDFVLGRTAEVFKFAPNVAGKVWTRSSLGRLGLRVANDAGWCDPNFHGSIVLELRNDGPLPISIPAGMRVGQVTFFLMTDNATKPYNGSYQQQFDFNIDAWKRSLQKAALEAADRKS